MAMDLTMGGVTNLFSKMEFQSISKRSFRSANFAKKYFQLKYNSTLHQPTGVTSKSINVCYLNTLQIITERSIAEAHQVRHEGRVPPTLDFGLVQDRSRLLLRLDRRKLVFLLVLGDRAVADAGQALRLRPDKVVDGFGHLGSGITAVVPEYVTLTLVLSVDRDDD